MKTLICVTLIVVGFVGFNQSADARSRRSWRAVPNAVAYDSHRPRATVQLVQLALQRRGYYPGLTSGELVAETRVAIRRYQRDRGLRKTGRIDRALLRSLGIR